MVALVGATLGIAFAYAFLQWIKANILGGIPFWMKFEIDLQVLVFTTAVAVVARLIDSPAAWRVPRPARNVASRSMST